MKNLLELKTLGALKEAGYQSKPIKEEMRDNLIAHMQKREVVFDSILGYADTVIPDIERAILSRHNMNLLGLRGQAKTSLARKMVLLLDEYIPVIEGSELNDDPFAPVSKFGRDQVAEHGDNTPIAWWHRDDRYTEKLATPDVTVADLIGDVDPIKAANLGLPYSDERVIHFGLVPNSNRSIFVINELPDLQPRIQVALFNILQEGDIQIRGFKVRLPLDLQFVFTANPEDYTNRGSIITPLKDRIQSQIITHYPPSVGISKQITHQEARIKPEQRSLVNAFELTDDLLEQVSFEARESEYIDQKSGVSARLSITAYECLISTAERRAIFQGGKPTTVRVADLFGIVPAITGKVELVYEGEQEGAAKVSHHLIGKSIRTVFKRLFSDPDQLKRKKENSPYQAILDWFSRNELDLLISDSDVDYRKELDKVPGLAEVVKKSYPALTEDEKYLYMEFVLHGLAEFSQLSRGVLQTGFNFKDLLGSVFSMDSNLDDDYES